jgi:hypothetical protein
LEPLAQRVYALTKLQNVELTGSGIIGVINAMNDRYAKRLRIDPSMIEKAHRKELEKLQH